MNKKKLIEIVAKDLNISKSQASKSISSVLDGIARILQKNHKVALKGFGNFKVKKRQARTVNNPRTNKPMNVSASNYLKFAASSALKKLIKK